MGKKGGEKVYQKGKRDQGTTHNMTYLGGRKGWSDEEKDRATSARERAAKRENGSQQERSSIIEMKRITQDREKRKWRKKNISRIRNYLKVIIA